MLTKPINDRSTASPMSDQRALGDALGALTQVVPCVTTRPGPLRILRKFDLLHFRQISRYKKRSTECLRSGVEQFCGSDHVAYPSAS